MTMKKMMIGLLMLHFLVLRDYYGKVLLLDLLCGWQKTSLMEYISFKNGKASEGNMLENRLKQFRHSIPLSRVISSFIYLFIRSFIYLWINIIYVSTSNWMRW